MNPLFPNKGVSSDKASRLLLPWRWFWENWMQRCLRACLN